MSAGTDFICGEYRGAKKWQDTAININDSLI
jgi:hypothetical protein